MAKKPSDRYSSAGELAKAATAAAGTVAPPRPALPRAEPAVEHPAVLGDLRESGRDGIHAVPAAASCPRRRRRRAPKKRFGNTQVALGAAMVVLFGVAVVLASMLIFGAATAARRRGRRWLRPPGTTTETVTPSATSSSPTTTSTTRPSTSSAALAGMTGTDGQGFVGHTARCDSGAARWRRYRPRCRWRSCARPRRGATSTEVSDCATAPTSNWPTRCPPGGGFDVTNPADGARYEIRPDRLRILSNGGVDSDEPALQYGSR